MDYLTDENQQVSMRYASRTFALRRARRRGAERRGIAAVEAGLCMPILLLFMLGMWEVGRMVQVEQILVNAAREGARIAAEGQLTVNGGNVPVTVTVVQQYVRDYLTAAGLPAAAISGAQIQIINKSGNSWSDPCNAKPMDKFQLSITIPPGTAYTSLKWGVVSTITGMNQISVSVNWVSLNDSEVNVSTQLPY
ncbi:MAG TPA: TadE family protein [Pirellulales bacterium]|nr:TadE family protein [Pirellulales bacterium]